MNRATLILLTGLLLGACSSSNASREAGDPNTLEADEIAQQGQATTLAELMEGRIPGVRATQGPDGRIQLRTRGTTSFRGDDAVLVVVDDIPVTLDPDGSIPGVTLHDIASIKMLNDLTQTSRYGMRGRNGVVLVVTKRGQAR